MNNDLISREALKKDFEKVYPLTTNEMGGIVNKRIYDIIDNAPTVEPCYQTTSCLDCGNYDKENHNCPRYCEVIKEAINSRPQGEWIEKEETPASVSYYCSVCKTEGIPITPFCPWCGAKMKGGADNEKTDK